MYRKKALTALLLALMTMGGCAALDTLQQLVQKPEIRFEGMALENTSLTEGDLLFKFNVSNPNPVGVTVSRVLYDLKVNGKTFVKNTLDKNIALQANGSGTVEVPVTVNYLDFFQSVADFVQADKLAYDLSGSVGVGPFDIPYQKKGDIAVPKLPKISLKNVGISGLSFTGGSLIFSLDVANPNPFALNLGGLDYSIKLGGKKFAEGTADKISPIAKNSRTVLKIPFRMQFLELGRSAYQLLTKPSAAYEISGNMKFGDKIFPFQKSGAVSFDKQW
jgi:LEA14-like dessication related protein